MRHYQHAVLFFFMTLVTGISACKRGGASGGDVPDAETSPDQAVVVRAVGVESRSDDGTYGIGSELTLAVTFDSPVHVEGTPRLKLETGDHDAEALYSGGTDTAELLFAYTVEAGQRSGDLNYESSAALLLPGSSLVGLKGQAVDPTLPASDGPDSLAAKAALVLDTAAPDAVQNLSVQTASLSADLSWSEPTAGATEYLVARFPSPANPVAPKDGHTYRAGEAIGDSGTVVYQGPSLAVHDAVPHNEVDFTYSVFSRSGSGNFGPGESISVRTSTQLWAAQTFDSVYSMVRFGQRLFLAGSFDQIGPPAGNILAYKENGAFGKKWPAADDTVRAIVADGNGGFFVGGRFKAIGNARRTGLAHVLSDGSIGSLNVAVEDGDIHQMIVDGSHLYLLGSFATVGSTSHPYLAVLNWQTNTVLPFRPVWDAGLRSMAIDANRLYVAGDFSHVDAAAKARLVAFNRSDWSIDATFDAGANNSILSIAISDGVLYAGGAFTTANGTVRNGGAAFLTDAVGTLTQWDPDANSTVQKLAVDDQRVYLHGYFTQVGGQGRQGLASVNKTNGSVTLAVGNTAFNAQNISVIGDRLFLANPYGSPALTVLSTDTLQASAFAANLPAASYAEAVVAVGDEVVVVGTFSLTESRAISNLAVIDLDTGAAESTDFQVDNYVNHIARVGDGICMVGAFSHVLGQVRQHFACIDPRSDTLMPLEPSFDQSPYRFAVSGTNIYVAGGFTTVNGIARANLAIIDSVTGGLNSADFQLDGSVTSILAVGDNLYIGGDFSHVGTEVRKNFAAFNTAGLLPISFDLNGIVTAMAVDEDRLLLGGRFTQIDGAPRAYFAAVDLAGSVLPINPGLHGGEVKGINVFGDALHICGEFVSVNGADRQGAATIDKTTGQLTGYFDSANGECEGQYVDGNYLYVFGDVFGRGAQPGSGYSRSPL